MSDLAIVGMGLVHIKSPIFIEESERTTTCDIECSLAVTGIFNIKLKFI